MFFVIATCFILSNALGDPRLHYTRLEKAETCRAGVIHLELLLDKRHNRSAALPDSIVIAAVKEKSRLNNFTKICEIRPSNHCGPQNVTGCFCSRSNDLVDVLTVKFNATPEIGKAGFAAYFNRNGTLGPPLDVFHLHMIYGFPFANLSLNGQYHDLDFCNVSLIPNSHLTLKFCAFNLSGQPYLYRLNKGTSLLMHRLAPFDHCIHDDMVVTGEDSFFEVGFIDDCQRTAAYYCQVSAIQQIVQECVDCTGETIMAQVVAYLCIAVASATVFIVTICSTSSTSNGIEVSQKWNELAITQSDNWQF